MGTTPRIPTGLGLDQNHGHVQPNGAYHYHGLPTLLIARLSGGEQKMTHVGWAADGYPVYAVFAYVNPADPKSGIKAMKSSYRLKTTERGGDGKESPTGKPDGSFGLDYEYVPGHGDLDEFGAHPRTLAVDHRAQRTGHGHGADPHHVRRLERCDVQLDADGHLPTVSRPRWRHGHHDDVGENIREFVLRERRLVAENALAACPEPKHNEVFLRVRGEGRKAVDAAPDPEDRAALNVLAEQRRTDAAPLGVFRREVPHLRVGQLRQAQPVGAALFAGVVERWHAQNLSVT
jgi:hypothetical protein